MYRKYREDKEFEGWSSFVFVLLLIPGINLLMIILEIISESIKCLDTLEGQDRFFGYKELNDTERKKKKRVDKINKVTRKWIKLPW